MSYWLCGSLRLQSVPNFQKGVAYVCNTCVYILRICEKTQVKVGCFTWFWKLCTDLKNSRIFEACIIFANFDVRISRKTCKNWLQKEDTQVVKSVSLSRSLCPRLPVKSPNFSMAHYSFGRPWKSSSCVRTFLLLTF